jgi:hypothetical protein
VLCFPFYGIGNYISATSSPSLGYIISIIVPLLIIIFYLIDMMYVKMIENRLNKNYLLLLIFIVSAISAMQLSYTKGLPDMSFNVVVFKSLLFIFPVHTFLVVNFYNKGESSNYLVDNTFFGLTVLLLINLFGFYGMGLTNEVHNIEGRINFPFLGGLYEGSNLLSIINLLLLFYIKEYRSNIFMLLLLLGYFFGTLALIFFINSRLGIIILLMVYALIFFNVVKKTKVVYIISLFTLPILLSSSLLIYEILQLPAFASILQRVDLIDVVTFNGRAFIWQNAFDWLFYDQTGIFFGNGYRGHFFIDLISDVARMWNEKNIHNMHLHSAALEIMVNQGLLGIIIFLILNYCTFSYLHNVYQKKIPDAPFFPVMIFMIFLLQVDSFMYIDSLGFFILSVFFSKIVVSGYETEEATISRQLQKI